MVKKDLKINPWFFRYLNKGEITVIAAISSIENATNRQIAIYGGFGKIEKGSKAEEKLKLLKTIDEQKEYIEKRLKNAIQTVKNIKRNLVCKGLLTKEIIDTEGNQEIIYSINYNWKKDEYLQEYNELNLLLPQELQRKGILKTKKNLI